MPRGERSEKGFAAMDEEKRRKMANKETAAAPEKGEAHELTPEAVPEAGTEGGETIGEEKEPMAAEIGREGRSESMPRSTPDGIRAKHAKAGRAGGRTRSSRGSGKRGGSRRQLRTARQGSQSHKK